MSEVNKKDVVYLNGDNLNLEKMGGLVSGNYWVGIEEKQWDQIEQSAELIKKWGDEERVMYGVTTGFGPFISTIIPSKYQSELQNNLIRSHAANVGPLFAKKFVRAAMISRLNMWAKGFAGVRRQTIELLRDMINKEVHPVVPEWGSVGASGDLTPLSHIGLSLIGEGKVEYQGKIRLTKEVFSEVGLEPIQMKYKEGLASINGTAMMTGVSSLITDSAWSLLKLSEIISSVLVEALLASSEPFEAYGNDLKLHTGQKHVAKNIRLMLNGSKLAWDREDIKQKQELLRKKSLEVGDVAEFGISMQAAYSLRAIPQFLGTIHDAFTYITNQVENELNSVDDNPIVNSEIDNVFQGANFHGQPIAYAMDMLSISLTQIGILSERQLNRMLDRTRSAGLSPFLARGKSGLRCGFEGLQYIPTSLVAECRTLCNPASIQSIPSNEENQDVVSMGLVAARKAREILNRIKYILAVELMAVCESLEERDRDKLSNIGKIVYNKVREKIPAYDNDNFMHPLVEKTKEEFIENNILINLVEKELNIKL